jgi:hypothetical protein
MSTYEGEHTIFGLLSLSTSNLKASEDPKRFWISGFRFTDQGCPASEASEVYFVNIPKSETLSVSKHFR